MNENQPPILSPNINPPPPIFPTTPAKSHSGLIIKIIIGVILIILIGSGVALGTRIWDPLWNPFRPEPEEVIEEMLTKMKEVKTLHSGVKVEFAATDEKLKSEMQMSMNFSSDSDITDSKNPKTAVDFDLTITTTTQGKPAEEISIAEESRIIGKTSYLKLDDLGLPSSLEFTLMMLGIDKSKILGQWIKIDKEALENLGVETQEPDLLEKEQKELGERILNLFKEKKVYYVREELPDEKIEEKKAYHYLLALDRAKIKEIIPELFEIIMEFSGKEMPEAGEFGTAFVAGGIAESVDKFLEKIGGINIDIWIGKKDELLYKTRIEKEIDVSEFSEGAEGKAIIKIDLNFSNFNKPVKIEAPENFIELEKILPPMPFFQPSLPNGVPQMPPTKPEGMPSTKYPYEQPFGQEIVYLLQASLLEILSGLLK